MSAQTSSPLTSFEVTPVSPTASPYRLVAMVPVSAMVTLSLMYLMHRLVFVEEVIIEDPATQSIAPFYMEEEVIETIREEAPKRPETETPPPAMIEPQYTDPQLHDDGGIDIGRYVPGDSTTPVINVNAGSSLVRQVGVPPQYPGRLLARGVEGFVDLQFDVTAYGATTNIQVLRSEPEGAFDGAAIKAVKRWKYRPRQVDGEAVASYNIRERIRFTIEK